MIINKGGQEKAEVIGGVDTSNSMRMNLNAQSYELLLSNLYSDPLGSTIRELCTNALEANMAAKTNKKVVVQLPSIINSNLIIRDFGTGLDDKEIDKYLNCLFSSSKGETNDAMGGFGLGSKSPLALVDSFFLSSVKDGIQYDYMWIKERGQIPTPIFQGSDKVDKENGITITVPLGSSSKIPLHNLTSHVKQSANRQLFGFKDQIMIVTDATVDYDKMTDVTATTITWKEVLDTPNVTLFTKDANAKNQGSNNSYNSRYGNPEIYIRVGVVVYRYNSNIDTSFLNNFIRNIRDFVLTINVPIGQLDIPMSREEVNTTADNARIINQVFNSGKADIEKEYKKIPFDFNVGAFKFQEQLKTYSNNSQIIWNIKSTINALSTNDLKLVSKYTDFVKDNNPNYKTMTVQDFFSNIDLYTPMQSYLQRFTYHINKSLIRFNLVNSNGTSLVTPTIMEDTAYVVMPSKLPFGVRLTDLYDYYRLKYPKLNLSKVLVVQIKNDCLKQKEITEYLTTILSDNLNLVGNTTSVVVPDIDLEDLKDEVKKLRAANKTTIVPNDYLVGTRLVKIEDKYSELNKAVDKYIWTNVNSTDKSYRVNKLLDAKGKTIPVGSEYVEDYDKVFLTATSSVPIKSQSSFSTLNKVEVSACLTNTCILKVSEAVLEKVKDNLTKAGVEFYTEDDPFEITVPTLEQFLVKDPSNVTYKNCIISILASVLQNFFSAGSWRVDKAALKTLILNFLTSVEKDYTDTSNIYFKYLLSEKEAIISKVIANSGSSRIDYNYNLANVEKFREELFEILVNGLVIKKSSWLKDYNHLTLYTDTTTKALFNKFGYNL